MTQEQKDLLLKDLCARLPYGVKIKTKYYKKATLIAMRKNISYSANKDLLVTYDVSGEETPYQSEERSSTISKIKPYLFHLSSMTEEQLKEYMTIPSGYWTIDWFNKNHFDYRCLIENGLAIDATGLNIY